MPQSCRIGAVRSPWGHFLGAGVSAIRPFRVVGRILARSAVFAAVFAAVVAGVLAAPSGATAQESCRLVTIGGATVRAATESGLALEDGRVVRLAGIEMSQPATLPAGTPIVLKRIGERETDRYGRLM